MVFYEKQGVSSCEIAGAVAGAALHDLRANLFMLDGFPQISVFTASDTEFTICLIWTGKNGTSNVEFLLSRNDAVIAVKKFRTESIRDTAIFERVQKAIAELEAKVRDGAV
jgi:hypothetical protein